MSRAVSILLLIIILSTIGVLAYIVGSPKQTEKFTEFYILGPTGVAADYPRKITIGQEATVIVGIINREQEVTDYTVEIATEKELLRELGPITLAHEEKWEQNVSISPTQVGNDQMVEFLLYKGESAGPYNMLHLWVDVKEAEQ